MRIRVVAIALTLGISTTAGLWAQSATSSGYLTPPKEIVDILDAEPIPTVTVSPNRDTLVVVSRRGMPGIEEVSQPMLRLAGLRINPRNNGPHRMPAGTGITLRTIAEMPWARGIYLESLRRGTQALPLAPDLVVQRGDILKIHGPQETVERGVTHIGPIIAPTTATERGSSTAVRLATSASFSRSASADR